MLEPLNFHHLHSFWAVAKDGRLTHAAQHLRVAPSALSAQIRQLEEHLGEELFHRVGRRLALTEAGQVALAYADHVFATGSELVATLQGGRRTRDALRVGAVSTLSRNFQESFVIPVLRQPDVALTLQSGGLDDLLDRLGRHSLDLVLSNRLVRRQEGRPWRCRRLARQGVSLVGRSPVKRFRFPDDLAGETLLLPGPGSEVRSEFDALCEQLGVKVSILAEVDDMAMMRLLARDTGAMALVPSVVVRDELRSGLLRERCVVPGLFESFYAITTERHFPHPLLGPLLARSEQDLLTASEGAAVPPRQGPTRRRVSHGAPPDR